MKLRPAQTAFGCCSLLVGVQAICLLSLLDAICLIASCSSKDPVRVIGVVIPPFMQVLLAAWAWIGIPLAIMAGVGAVHRVAQNLLIFAGYMLASFVVGAAVALWLLVSGSACAVVVDPEIQRMGSAFVCGFTDTFFLTWTLVFGMLHLYFTYIVWSASEEAAQSAQLRLLQYHHSLESTKVPSAPPGRFALSPKRAEVLEGSLVHPPVKYNVPLGSVPLGAVPFGSSMPPTSGAALPSAGEPQSFIPRPATGVDFATSSVF